MDQTFEPVGIALDGYRAAIAGLDPKIYRATVFVYVGFRQTGDV
jgi:hypothetical protein